MIINTVDFKGVTERGKTFIKRHILNFLFV